MQFTIAYKSELRTYIDEPKTQKCLSKGMRAWVWGHGCHCAFYYTIKQDPGYPFKLYACKCRALGKKNLQLIGDHINTKLKNKYM